MTPRRRPVFLPELGRRLKAQRKARGWSLRGTASIAARRRLPLTYQVLFRIERGQVKNLEPETLRAVATLYTMNYDRLAAEYVQNRYGVPMADADQFTEQHSTTAGGRTESDESNNLRANSPENREILQLHSADALAATVATPAAPAATPAAPASGGNDLRGPHRPVLTDAALDDDLNDDLDELRNIRNALVHTAGTPSEDVIDRLEAAVTRLAELGELFIDATEAATGALIRRTRKQTAAARRVAPGKSARARKGRG